NYIKAARYFHLAAKQGLAEALFNLGLLYANGNGVKKNKRIARELLRKSCTNGEPEVIKLYQRLK
ncbi:MAG: sel1 repeat family protein, partial [Snodgrassella sp.]|nr:sel1 repeat family protein [Snodgrassella sp.]